ncbi:uncharacterized protein LOC125067839 [Vanessa atalanta]|uniref:uncharacterized protein LOC125067839 n=1 Tax=Vanessa atalanta TaxID=42275 RepID=UPI001FCD84DC|nr:uncharacterized protein LOC125067839 [Vanessa atalanta]
MNWQYYCECVLGWMLNNKIIVFLGLLSFCLFVSTLALAGQRNRLSREVEDLRQSTTSSPVTQGPTTQNPTTQNPTTQNPTTSDSEVTVTTSKPEEVDMNNNEEKSVIPPIDQDEEASVIEKSDGITNDLNLLKRSRFFNVLAVPA